MPSPYSSSGSIDDSRQLAANLGIRFETISISELFADFNHVLWRRFSADCRPTQPKRISSLAFAARF
jgi:NH3-dependent NAD+ synthetase